MKLESLRMSEYAVGRQRLGESLDIKASHMLRGVIEISLAPSGIDRTGWMGNPKPLHTDHCSGAAGFENRAPNAKRPPHQDATATSLALGLAD